MRLGYSKSKNATSLYVIESTYIHGKRSTRIVEKLGTMEELSKIHEDPIVWAKEYIEDLNQKQVIEKARNIENSEIIIKYSTAKSISKGNHVSAPDKCHQLAPLDCHENDEYNVMENEKKEEAYTDPPGKIAIDIVSWFAPCILQRSTRYTPTTMGT